MKKFGITTAVSEIVIHFSMRYSRKKTCEINSECCLNVFFTQPRRSPDSDNIQDGTHQVTEHTAMLHSTTLSLFSHGFFCFHKLSHLSLVLLRTYLNFLQNYATISIWLIAIFPKCSLLVNLNLP